MCEMSACTESSPALLHPARVGSGTRSHVSPGKVTCGSCALGPARTCDAKVAGTSSAQTVSSAATKRETAILILHGMFGRGVCRDAFVVEWDRWPNELLLSLSM